MGLSILKVKGCLGTGNLGATNVLVVATTYQKSQPMLSCRMVVRVSGPGPAENYRSVGAGIHSTPQHVISVASSTNLA